MAPVQTTRRRLASATRPRHRRAMRTATSAILLALAAGGGAFAAPAPNPEPAAPPKTVSSLTVVPGDRAKLVSSFPAAGQVVAPGVLILKITFDQKMLETGFDIEPAPGAALPNCLKQPRLLNDGKTFVLLCTTAPKTSYALAFNANKTGGFQNLGEIPAAPARLGFSTNNEDGPTDIGAAMKVAGLSDGGLPIEDAPLNPSPPAQALAQISPP